MSQHPRSSRRPLLMVAAAVVALGAMCALLLPGRNRGATAPTQQSPGEASTAAANHRSAARDTPSSRAPAGSDGAAEADDDRPSRREQYTAAFDRKIERNRKLLKDLSPEQQTIIDQITTSLVNKILHRPISQLKEAAHDPEGPEFIDIVRAVGTLDVPIDETSSTWKALSGIVIWNSASSSSRYPSNSSSARSISSMSRTAPRVLPGSIA